MADLTHALHGLTSRFAEYEQYEAYYEGEHRMVFASEKFRSTFGHRFSTFADNLCPSVVNAVADRLQVISWSGSDVAVAAADGLWKASRMQRQAGETHLEAIKCGDSYVLVWPDAQGVVRMYAHEAESCFVAFDEELPGQVSFAAKTWRVGKHVRVNLFYPDRVERYIAESDSGMPKAEKFKPFDGDGEAPVFANPWGTVPVFHFSNDASLGEEGRSELANVVPLQDALNKINADMLVSMEYHAMPQRYRIGVDVPIDPITGHPIAPKQGPGVMWDLGEGATVGQFPQGDFTPFLNAAASYREEIARVSRTPLHVMGLTSSNFPSGEALKTAERTLTDKVLDRQVAFGGVWADAMSLAVRMAGASSDPVEPVWAAAETTSEAEQLSNAVLKEQVGFTRRRVLLDLGMPAVQVDEMLAEADAAAASAADIAMKAFNSGMA
jgi:hypothetical protein